MSLSAIWSSLSCLSKLFVGFVFLLWVVAGIEKPIMWGLVPVLMVPTLAYAFWANRHPVELDLVLRLYGAGMVPGAFVVLCCELLLGAVFLLVCFSDQIGRLLEDLQSGLDFTHIQVDRTVGLFFFLVLAAWIVASFTEESMKYYLISCVKQNRPEFNDWKGFLVYAVAPALGFSTIENIGYTSSAATVESALVTCFTRLAVTTPVHCLTGYLLGLGVVRREVFGEPLRWYRVMLVPVGFHGFFDFVLFLLGTYGDHLDDEWPLTTTLIQGALALTCLVSFALYVRYDRGKLIHQYHLQEADNNSFLPVDDMEAGAAVQE